MADLASVSCWAPSKPRQPTVRKLAEWQRLALERVRPRAESQDFPDQRPDIPGEIGDHGPGQREQPNQQDAESIRRNEAEQAGRAN